MSAVGRQPKNRHIIRIAKQMEENYALRTKTKKISLHPSLADGNHHRILR